MAAEVRQGKTTSTYETQGQQCFGHDLRDKGSARRSETPHNTNTVRYDLVPLTSNNPLPSYAVVDQLEFSKRVSISISISISKGCGEVA